MMESRLSALADGELEQEEAMALLTSIKEQQGLREEWMLLHLIGDTLRQTHSLSSDFNTRFSAQLAKEPTVLAPRTIFHESQPSALRSFSAQLSQRSRPLIALSAAASVAAISLVAWAAFQFSHEPGTGPTANVVVAENSQNNAASAGNFSGYLAAHQEYSHATQESSAYQRAAFEKPQGRGR
ncbi:MAG: sigma-E factor negative regulatory protein [Sulfuricella sp.]|nr:sigma-E factor negative regulatory protein [Sulfuricella sp.]